MTFLLIALIAVLMTRISAGIGFRLGAVDLPDSRKLHNGAISWTGGVAIIFTLLTSTFALGISPYSYPMLAIICGAFVAGLFGDVRHLRASTRLLLHFGCGVLLAWQGDIVILNVGNLLAMGDIPLLALAVPLTALSVAGLCNAYNMIDGIDGLAATTAALPLLILYGLALQADHALADALLTVLIPLAVFLGFNLGPASRLVPKIFLGDSGSVTLGFFVTASLVYFSQGEGAIIEPVTALWLVTLPLMDMLATMGKRRLEGQKVMQADRSHVHHILMGMGFSSRQTLCILCAWGLMCAVLGLALEAVPAYLSLLCYFLVFAAHCLFVLRTDAFASQFRQARSQHSNNKNLQENTLSR